MAEGRLGHTFERDLELLGHDEVDLRSDEERRILLWRLNQFCGLGFDYATSVVMTDAPVDLAQARRLVAAGCPHEMASRILL